MRNKADQGEQDEIWVSISDLMSGLMMIFLFVAVSYMIRVQARTDILRQQVRQAEIHKSEAETLKQQEQRLRQRMESVALGFFSYQERLYQALVEEFKEDLPRWRAQVYAQTLSVRFEEPDVLFEQGSAQLSPIFKNILVDFFPRYVRILNSPFFADAIDEIRIEGHTSSEWSEKVTPLVAYFNNMRLSQDRTRSVLEYVLTMPELEDKREWLQSLLTANGLSSSKLIRDDQGQEIRELSRRVEFRVRVRAEDRIRSILEAGKDDHRDR